MASCLILVHIVFFFFFFNDTATTEIYTLSLHDALPISRRPWRAFPRRRGSGFRTGSRPPPAPCSVFRSSRRRCVSTRSEEHTSELQSPCNLVCRLLLEKKKKKHTTSDITIIHCGSTTGS